VSTRVFVAKFIPDPARWEPRNVGVIVARGEERAAWFAGESQPGKVDGREVRHLGNSAETYRTWVQYWRHEVVERGREPASLEEVGGSSFFISQAGEAWIEDEAPLRDLVREYFDRLVRPLPEEPRPEDLQATVDRVLKRAEIWHRKEFHRDYEVEAHRPEGVERLRFNYAYRNGSLIVGQRVPLIDAYAHDALWRFTSISAEITRVAFVSAIGTKRREPWWPVLENAAKVVDVSEPDAEDRVVELFLGRAA
jgi:hypothetical protein